MLTRRIDYDISDGGHSGKNVVVTQVNACVVIFILHVSMSDNHTFSGVERHVWGRGVGEGLTSTQIQKFFLQVVTSHPWRSFVFFLHV